MGRRNDRDIVLGILGIGVIYLIYKILNVIGKFVAALFRAFLVILPFVALGAVIILAVITMARLIRESLNRKRNVTGKPNTAKKIILLCLTSGTAVLLLALIVSAAARKSNMTGLLVCLPVFLAACGILYWQRSSYRNVVVARPRKPAKLTKSGARIQNHPLYDALAWVTFKHGRSVFDNPVLFRGSMKDRLKDNARDEMRLFSKLIELNLFTEFSRLTNACARDRLLDGIAAKYFKNDPLEKKYYDTAGFYLDFLYENSFLDGSLVLRQSGIKTKIKDGLITITGWIWYFIKIPFIHYVSYYRITFPATSALVSFILLVYFSAVNIAAISATPPHYYQASETSPAKRENSVPSLPAQPPAAEQPQVAPQPRYVWVKSTALNVRRNPSAESAIITRLNYNSKAQVLSRSGGWARIKYGTIEGFVNESYLSENPLPMQRPAQTQEQARSRRQSDNTSALNLVETKPKGKE